jgi:hypothetical protein
MLIARRPLWRSLGFIGEELMANLLWLQGGACSGNTMSFLNAEEPSACDLVTDFGINVLWHPSLGLELGDNVRTLLEDCVSGTIGLDTYGRSHGKYISWGYLPHEDKYNKPTIDGRNAALIMKSGVYDGASDSHKLMDQSLTREDTKHAWYDEKGGLHPYDRKTSAAWNACTIW